MTKIKLKTLKDIEEITTTREAEFCLGNNAIPVITKDRLKEEAIKHLKSNADYEFLPNICPKCKMSISFPEGEIYHLEGPSCGYYTEIWKEFVKYFFDIKGSDLE